MLTLATLKAHLIERGSASLGDLALALDADRIAVRQALERFEAKGCARRLQGCRTCAGCSLCGGTGEEVWEWRDPAVPPEPAGRHPDGAVRLSERTIR